MADRQRVLETTWLFLAGVASLCSSLLGCVGILGTSWMRYSALQTIPFVLLLLEVPAFALVMMLSRRFMPALWTIAIAYPVTILLFDRETYTSASGLMIFVGLGTIGPLLTAVFSRFNVLHAKEGHGNEEASNG